MRVCMLVTNSLRKDPRVQREAFSAYKDGFETIVIGCNDDNYSQEFLNSLPYKTSIVKGLSMSSRNKFIRMLSGSIGMFLINRALYKECLKFKPDVVHANDLDTLMAAYWVSKKNHCRVIYDSHELFVDQPYFNNKKLIKKILTFIEKHIIKRINNVVSVSNAAADFLEKKYNIARPTVVTNCSVFVPKEKLLTKSENFEVLYHGIISSYRGYEEFIQSAKYTMAEVVHVIRGYGPLKDYLIEYSNSNKLIEKVRFDDPVEISELIPQASKSSVGVVLTVPISNNYKYTVSNKIFEYVQARIPVILSDTPEHKYLNDKYRLGIIVESVSPKLIAEAINKFFMDKDFYIYYKNKLEEASKELCWEIEVKKLLRLYK